MLPRPGLASAGAGLELGYEFHWYKGEAFSSGLMDTGYTRTGSRAVTANSWRLRGGEGAIQFDGVWRLQVQYSLPFRQYSLPFRLNRSRRRRTIPSAEEDVLTRLPRRLAIRQDRGWRNGGHRG